MTPSSPVKRRGLASHIDPNGILCQCGIPALQLVSHTEKNPNRPFFKCSKEEDRCKFFKWADELSGPGVLVQSSRDLDTSTLNSSQDQSQSTQVASSSAGSRDTPTMHTPKRKTTRTAEGSARRFRVIAAMDKPPQPAPKTEEPVVIIEPLAVPESPTSEDLWPDIEDNWDDIPSAQVAGPSRPPDVQAPSFSGRSVVEDRWTPATPSIHSSGLATPTTSTGKRKMVDAAAGSDDEEDAVPTKIPAPDFGGGPVWRRPDIAAAINTLQDLPTYIGTLEHEVADQRRTLMLRDNKIAALEKKIKALERRLGGK